MKLSDVIDELVEERGLDKESLADVVTEGIHAAYAKRYPDLDLSVTHNRKTDQLAISIKKLVVSRTQDEDREISLKKARFFEPNTEVGQVVEVPFEGGIGRIEVLRAKQVIASKIRGMEAAAVYKEFEDKQGAIVSGVIHKCERSGVTIKISDAIAFLPKSLSIPTDKCLVGYSIRALLKDVLEEPRGDTQLILDRASSGFVQRLFELEVPEIFERLVEVKKVVRIPGYKTKIAVSSNDKNIDPVGTCVGVGGVRIRPILKELGGEKIDVILWSDSPEALVAQALKPAVINRVDFLGEEKGAEVWLDSEQRSVAIGRLGQNILLASQLVGFPISLVDTSATEKDADVVLEEAFREEG